ncbi:MAG: HAD family hydrolase, partial [bacterium]|nr:HAD family hydrolase [bacterium]
MTIAFFDLDKTLLSVNSARLWIRNQRNNNIITKWQMLQFSYGLLRYYFGSSNIENQINEAILLIKGKSEAQFLEEMHTFYHTEVKKEYRPAALLTLEKHR